MSCARFVTTQQGLLELQASQALSAEAAQPELAIERAGFVLAAAPGHQGMLNLVSRCAPRVDSPAERPDARFPTDPLLYAALGQFEAAVLALLHIVEALPDRDWLPWCVPWLAHIPDERLPLPEILPYLARMMRRFPKVVCARETERAALRRVFPLLDALAPRLRKHVTFLVFAADLTRTAADTERALRFAEQALALEETYDTVLTAASCQRFLGNTDAALALLQRAAELDESQRAVMLRDQRLTLEEGGRYAEALALHEHSAPLGDNHFRCFLRFRLGLPVDAEWAPFFESCPRDLSATEADTAAHVPHVGWLVAPTDATLRALQRSPADAPLSLVEPRPGGIALFRYLHTRDATGQLLQQACTPLLPEPSAATRQIVEQLAGSWYHLPRWWAAAKVLAPSIRHSDELLASMAWIGRAPPGMPAWEWVQRTQRAAACLLGQRDDGWLRLREVALGTPDWSVAAAVLALTELALDRPERARETRGLFSQLISQAPAALRCVRPVLVDCALRLPDWPKQALIDWRAQKQSQQPRQAET